MASKLPRLRPPTRVAKPVRSIGKGKFGKRTCPRTWNAVDLIKAAFEPVNLQAHQRLKPKDHRQRTVQPGALKHLKPKDQITRTTAPHAVKRPSRYYHLSKKGQEIEKKLGHYIDQVLFIPMDVYFSPGVLLFFSVYGFNVHPDLAHQYPGQQAHASKYADPFFNISKQKRQMKRNERKPSEEHINVLDPDTYDEELRAEAQEVIMSDAPPLDFHKEEDFNKDMTDIFEDEMMAEGLAPVADSGFMATAQEPENMAQAEAVNSSASIQVGEPTQAVVSFAPARNQQIQPLQPTSESKTPLRLLQRCASKVKSSNPVRAWNRKSEQLKIRIRSGRVHKRKTRRSGARCGQVRQSKLLSKSAAWIARPYDDLVYRQLQLSPGTRSPSEQTNVSQLVGQSPASPPRIATMNPSNPMIHLAHAQPQSRSYSQSQSHSQSQPAESNILPPPVQPTPALSHPVQTDNSPTVVRSTRASPQPVLTQASLATSQASPAGREPTQPTERKLEAMNFPQTREIDTGSFELKAAKTLALEHPSKKANNVPGWGISEKNGESGSTQASRKTQRLLFGMHVPLETAQAGPEGPMRTFSKESPSARTNNKDQAMEMERSRMPVPRELTRLESSDYMEIESEEQCPTRAQPRSAHPIQTRRTVYVPPAQHGGSAIFQAGRIAPEKSSLQQNSQAGSQEALRGNGLPHQATPQQKQPQDTPSQALISDPSQSPQIFLARAIAPSLSTPINSGSFTGFNVVQEAKAENNATLQISQPTASVQSPSRLQVAPEVQNLNSLTPTALPIVKQIKPEDTPMDDRERSSIFNPAPTRTPARATACQSPLVHSTAKSPLASVVNNLAALNPKAAIAAAQNSSEEIEIANDGIFKPPIPTLKGAAARLESHLDQVPDKFRGQAGDAIQKSFDTTFQGARLPMSSELVPNLALLVRSGPGAEIDEEQFSFEDPKSEDRGRYQAMIDIFEASSNNDDNDADIWPAVFIQSLREGIAPDPTRMMTDQDAFDGPWCINMRLIDDLALHVQTKTLSREGKRFLSNKLPFKEESKIEKYESFMGLIRRVSKFFFWDFAGRWMDKQCPENLMSILRQAGFCPDSEHAQDREFVRWFMKDAEDPEVQQRCRQVWNLHSPRFVEDVRMRWNRGDSLG